MKNKLPSYMVTKVERQSHQNIVVYFEVDDYIGEVNLPFDLNIIINKEYEHSFLTEYDKMKCRKIYNFISDNHPEWIL